MNRDQLIELAIEARTLSYSPYSHFAVGAALLCKDGSVYVGSNVENASYPLSMCAERNALYSAFMDHKSREDFVAMAVVGDTDSPITP
ncbi:MAG: cytidine deaminase, partial [Bacilli bacterium]|nr:cytidine deaminase [Bacilli bacterium]